MWRLQKIGNKRTQEDENKDCKNGEPDINEKGGRLHLIFLVGIFWYAQELDHGVAKQTLFDHFGHGNDHEKKRPNTIVGGGNMPHQYEIGNHSKKDNGEPIE